MKSRGVSAKGKSPTGERKKPPLSPEEQSKLFVADAEKLIEPGALKAGTAKKTPEAAFTAVVKAEKAP